VHFLQENYADALRCYDRAIELNGDVKEFYHNRALVRRRMGLYAYPPPPALCPRIL
jgi:tetratricopeptide (TPR) repeat protein